MYQNIFFKKKKNLVFIMYQISYIIHHLYVIHIKNTYRI